MIVRIINSILILTFTAFVLNGPVAWLTYAFFADEIAAVYCVNPDTPSCHGKCHITSETTKQSEQNSIPRIEVRIESFTAILTSDTESFRLISTSSIYPALSNGHLTSGYPHDIERPPIFA